MDVVVDLKAQKTEHMASARALWEDLAVKARSLHCPEHVVGPWRIAVIGETPDSLRLQVYGCCEKIGRAVTEMIGADPRTSRQS